jgi:hypothetical protein
MRVISFGLAGMVALILFGAFGSVGLRGKPTVEARVASMHAVLPDGALVSLTGA